MSNFRNATNICLFKIKQKTGDVLQRVIVKSKLITIYALAFLLLGGNAARAETLNEHHFEEPYQCDRSREVTSSSTGVTRVVHSRSVYFPDLDWRINLYDTAGESVMGGGFGTANLFSPNFRYDGYYRDQGEGISSITMETAWPQDESKRGLSGRMDADDDIGKCMLLDAAQQAFYSFDYLDDLEVMGQ